MTPSRDNVKNLAIYISVTGCGNYKITQLALVPINKSGKFSFSGQFYANGIFTGAALNSITAQGKLGLGGYFIQGCGYVSGGPFSWTATWKNSTQPAGVRVPDLNSVLVVPVPDSSSGFLIVDPTGLEP